MTIRLYLFVLSLLFCCKLLAEISIGSRSIKELEETQIRDTMSHAIDRLKHSSDGYSLLNNHLVSVRMLGLAQAFGDPTYTKYEPFATYRIYGYSGISLHSITRQSISDVVSDSFLLPAQYEPDFDNKDINAHAKTVFSGHESKVGFFFNPLQGKYKHNIYSILEFNFTGTTAFNTGCLTIRQAFGEVTWSTGAFVFGQYYHPLFLKECFPRTVNGNTGAPYEAISIVPQIRLTQSIKKLEFTLTAANQAFRASWGPFMILFFKNVPYFISNSNTYIRNSMVPDLNFILKWILDNNSYYGFSFDYLNLCPMIDDTDHKTNVRVNSFVGEIYAHNVLRSGEINMKLIYSQNGANQLLISGFGPETVNPITGVTTSYSPTNAISFWIDSFYLFKDKTMQLGIFLGATKNLGSFKQLYLEPSNNQPEVFTLDDFVNIGLRPDVFVSRPVYLVSYAYRTSIRYVYNKNPFRIGVELEFDASAYGNALNKYAIPLCVKPVYSFSYLISMAYVY